MIDYENLQARCQRGEPSLSAANNLLAECRAAIGRLLAENERVENLASSERDRVMSIIGQYGHFEAENKVLRSKLSTIHFVCDRLPDQDGCRFIELENPQGESMGDELGKWEIRPDGLAQLVVEISDCHPGKGEQQ